MAEKKVAQTKQRPVAEKRVAQPKKVTPQQQPNRISRFFRETVGELRKVNWPTRQEAINLTTIVLIVIVVMALFLGSLDILFTELFALILGA